MELASQAYQRWLHEARERETDWGEEVLLVEDRKHHKPRYHHTQVGPLDNGIMEQEEKKRLNITFRLYSH